MLDETMCRFAEIYAHNATMVLMTTQSAFLNAETPQLLLVHTPAGLGGRQRDHLVDK